MDDTAKTICVYTAMDWASACVEIRLLGPFRQFGWNVVRGDVKDPNANDVSPADVVVIHREFPGMGYNYGKVIWKCHMEQKPVLLELDDLLTEIPAEHPEFSFLNGIRPAILDAIGDVDAVIVSTELLRQYLLKLNEKILVVPNFLNSDLWQMRNPSEPEIDQVVTIGYAGTVTHKPDLEYFGAALREIAVRYGNRVKFEFVGASPPEVLHDLADVSWRQFDEMGYVDYVRKMNGITFDIAIAPIVDNPFNRCKSHIKHLEYSAMGAAGVFSALDPYASIVTHGTNGFLAKTSDEWIECLALLIENPSMRWEMAKQAQREVFDHHLLEQNKNRIKNMFSEFIEIV